MPCDLIPRSGLKSRIATPCAATASTHVTTKLSHASCASEADGNEGRQQHREGRAERSTQYHGKSGRPPGSRSRMPKHGQASGREEKPLKVRDTAEHLELRGWHHGEDQRKTQPKRTRSDELRCRVEDEHCQDNDDDCGHNRVSRRGKTDRHPVGCCCHEAGDGVVITVVRRRQGAPRSLPGLLGEEDRPVFCVQRVRGANSRRSARQPDDRADHYGAEGDGRRFWPPHSRLLSDGRRQRSNGSVLHADRDEQLHAVVGTAI